MNNQQIKDLEKQLWDSNEIENAFMNLIEILQFFESKDNRGFFADTNINRKCKKILLK